MDTVTFILHALHKVYMTKRYFHFNIRIYVYEMPFQIELFNSTNVFSLVYLLKTLNGSDVFRLNIVYLHIVLRRFS